MRPAALHPNEKQRIEALKLLEILDTPPEAELDELVKIASQICETPMAAISLVDSSRQWFKAKVGFEATETPRDIAFCAHAIHQDNIFIVADSKLDSRFSDNPLVTGEPHVIFYAGVPISVNNSPPVGTLCVIDTVPRQLRPEQIQALTRLSKHVSQLLELRSFLKSTKEKAYSHIFQSTAYEKMIEGVVIHDRAGRIIHFNPASTRVLGLSEDQLTGKKSVDSDWHSIREDGTAFPGEEHPAMQTLKTGTPLIGTIMGIQTSQPEVRWLSINSTPLYLDNESQPSHVLVTFSDITEVRKAQKVVIQSAKMSALGEMAASIAHEINTPLTIIATSTQQLQKEFENTQLNHDAIKVRLSRIEKTIQRISGIIKGLKNFSRTTHSDKPAASSVTEIVQDTISLCSERFRNNNIDLQVEIDHDEKILVVATEISQVLLNLLNNSFDAVLNSEERWIKVRVKDQNQDIVIEIIDSGPGVRPDLVDKIMQPFFTTKGPGIGSGLGLSISRGIIERHQGVLCIDPLARHTTFRVKLPKLNQKAKAS